MNSILILLALSLLAGVVAARSYFSWPALIVASLVIAPTGAVVLQQESFGPLLPESWSSSHASWLAKLPTAWR
jgi:hypothetical protein